MIKLRTYFFLFCFIAAVCSGCAGTSTSDTSKELTPVPDDGFCRDIQGEVITDYRGKPIKADSEQCSWIRKNLNGQAPCRTKDGFVVYDEMGRPFPAGSYCAKVIEELEEENRIRKSLEKNKAS